MSLLTAFCNQSINFVTELENLFPEENDIKTYKNNLLFLKKTNPRSMVNYFKQYINPYIQYIELRDERFFLGLPYDESMGGDKYSMMKAIEFKKLWGNMSEQSKIACWQYFEILLALSNKL